MDMQQEKKQMKANEKGELLRFIITALIVIVSIRYFVATPFIVSGESMDKTFHNNDYLIVDKLSYRFSEPARGDIIVFEFPLDTTRHHIKRIVGLPGETISTDGESVRIVNDTYPEGTVLKEPYISMHEITYRDTRTLGPDEYYVMGDNRDNSLDSRRSGPLNKRFITGRALVRLYPFTGISLLPGKYTQAAEETSITN